MTFRLQVTLLKLLKAYEVVLRKHSIQAAEDTYYYRLLLKLSLDPSPDWWAKLARERELAFRQVLLKSSCRWADSKLPCRTLRREHPTASQLPLLLRLGSCVQQQRARPDRRGGPHLHHETRERLVLQASQGPAEVAQPSAPAASAASGQAGVPARLTPQPCRHA